jgi:glucose-6-phosphate isomerase
MLTERATWKALQSHYQKMREVHMRSLFADDPKRGERLTAEAIGIFLDYSGARRRLRRARQDERDVSRR